VGVDNDNRCGGPHRTNNLERNAIFEPSKPDGSMLGHLARKAMVRWPNGKELYDEEAQYKWTQSTTNGHTVCSTDFVRVTHNDS